MKRIDDLKLTQSQLEKFKNCLPFKDGELTEKQWEVFIGWVGVYTSNTETNFIDWMLEEI